VINLPEAFPESFYVQMCCMEISGIRMNLTSICLLWISSKILGIFLAFILFCHIEYSDDLFGNAISCLSRI
jgi:hypothetical protein